MSVKIRLQRKGRRKKPYYHIVVADARAPRDGRYIERLGSYNPGTVPATITLNVDSSVEWLAKGAQPTDTVRSILSFKGVMFRHHLNKGIAKGALTEEQANEKFNAWIAEKETLIQGQVDKEATKKETALNDLFKLETKKKEERAAKILEKNTPPAEEAAEATEEGAEASTEGEVVAETETPTEDAPTEEVVAEVVEEAPVEKVEEEAPKEETPEVVAETEAPKEEEKKEDSDTKEA